MTQQRIGFRLVHALAAMSHDMPGDTDDRAVGRDIVDHDRAAADLGVGADGDAAEHRRTHAHGHPVLDGGMTLTCLLTGAAERDALIEHDVIADDGGLADDDTAAVVYEEAAAYLGGRMDLDAGGETRELREPTRETLHVMLPQPVLPAMVPYRMQAGIGQDDRGRRRARGIPVLRRLYVLYHLL